MKEIPELFDLTNRVAIVTGGAGLLGAEFCRTLAEAGAKVVVADIDREAAIQTALELSADGCDALGMQIDISASQSVQGLVADVLDTYQRVDILINSAALDPKFDPQHIPAGGVQTDSAFETYPLSAWQQALDVNLTGAFLCCQAVAPAMLAQKSGVIVNISSMYGITGPDQRLYQRKGKPPVYKPVYYSVTKAGMLGLTRYLATYYAGKNIRVNALTPGGVYNNHDDEFLQAYAARSVLGRMADKQEMNGALLFLASDASSYMTGANLVVDGGWTAW